jgi:hypothetical protein
MIKFINPQVSGLPFDRKRGYSAASWARTAEIERQNAVISTQLEAHEYRVCHG